jgi:hypothetical protein
MIILDSLYVRRGRFTNPHHENDKERKLAPKGVIDEHIQRYYENGGEIEQTECKTSRDIYQQLPKHKDCWPDYLCHSDKPLWPDYMMGSFYQLKPTESNINSKSMEVESPLTDDNDLTHEPKTAFDEAFNQETNDDIWLFYEDLYTQINNDELRNNENSTLKQEDSSSRAKSVYNKLMDLYKKARYLIHRHSDALPELINLFPPLRKMDFYIDNMFNDKTMYKIIEAIFSPIIWPKSLKEAKKITYPSNYVDTLETLLGHPISQSYFEKVLANAMTKSKNKEPEIRRTTLLTS